MMRTLAGALAPWVVNWQDGIISRFNREVLDPDIWYQFGLNDLEGFRVVDGATAATLVDRKRLGVGLGADAPARDHHRCRLLGHGHRHLRHS